MAVLPSLASFWFELNFSPAYLTGGRRRFAQLVIQNMKSNMLHMSTHLPNIWLVAWRSNFSSCMHIQNDYDKAGSGTSGLHD